MTFMAGSLLGLLLCTPLTAAASIGSVPTTLLASSAASFLITSATANSVLDDLDRPQAAEKVNVHGWGDSSDDSSDDSDDDGDDTCIKRNPDGSCQVWNNVQHFRNDFGEIEMKWSSCNDPYDDSHDDFEEVAVENSLYQKVIFEENLKKEDKCLRLDNTLQQCSSYRPHYHEPFVHLSAAYLNEGYMSGVRRVVFVGGGDSMLLHEILKYPNIELVLGLELDQKVTRNSFEHFKTQPHFDNPKVQWWFGDGAKSLTLLPRSYFGTFDLVLLDLSETVMSMTVTKGLDVFGAMKLLLSPTGILVKNDFGYFEKLTKVFDTCMQLLIPDVTYICDYELVLCSSDQVDFLNPSFYHLEGVKEGQVDTLVYKPQDDVDDHWGPVTDYSKYWGEPRDCFEVGADNGIDESSIAYAGVLMIVEAENVSMNVKDAKAVGDAIEKPLKELGYEVISSTTTDSSEGGAIVAISMKEGYVLLESWPAAKYCKLDIHLWGGFEKQEDIRTEVLKILGSAAGDWQSFRIVTGGMRGTDTRATDLKVVGPDLAKIGQCEEASPNKSITHNSSYNDEAALGPVIDAGLEDIITMMVGTSSSGLSPVVFCNVKGSPCRAKANIEKQGFSNLITLWSCSAEEEKEMDAAPYNRGQAMSRWREAMKTDANEFSLCGKKAEVALKEISKKVQGLNLIVADALTPPEHVVGAQQYWLKYWKSIKKPFLFIAPILDAKDTVRTNFLYSRYNHGEELPEFYSEIYVGNGEKTMSFGMIHEGSPESLRKLLRSQVKLDQNDAVKFTDIRKVTIRGAMREQTNYKPVTFSWADYDQRPGLEQFYAQRPVGLQSVYQIGLAPDAKGALSFSSIEKAFKSAVHQWGSKKGSLGEAIHEISQGALFIALSSEVGQVVVTWDGADSININIFTYDETANHMEAFGTPFTDLLPATNLMLSDEQPRGYGKVINKSERVNNDESPDCNDHYKSCIRLTENGNCNGGNSAAEWMKSNCPFSCKQCDKNSSYAKTEL
mmetsp:Transcript_13035/g.28293  ORF Transcript_13035/g.28293 Transcript_13035/m.28293 type:complete len:1007 (+) Transcript_13035:82-3102(+)|eukprot:CAMPEP_0172298502 /NCGR_PEP_ID=MMETSP1058-20130122/1128_1 /TAXON_ID=83371 /ORGANISM="Detonula confervacea, Strain CCMP 353" /LENGTH=1006 /DNA_ID=CAMNT_0013007777 /DNA_START=15 /DNA_END=3035 /DNA_ORIENTATION=+